MNVKNLIQRTQKDLQESVNINKQSKEVLVGERPIQKNENRVVFKIKKDVDRSKIGIGMER